MGFYLGGCPKIPLPGGGHPLSVLSRVTIPWERPSPRPDLLCGPSGRNLVHRCSEQGAMEVCRPFGTTSWGDVATGRPLIPSSVMLARDGPVTPLSKSKLDAIPVSLFTRCLYATRVSTLRVVHYLFLYREAYPLL